VSWGALRRAPQTPRWGCTRDRGRRSARGGEIATHGRRRTYQITLRGERCVLGERTWVMGVLNVTPDSFSDGGQHLDPERALARGLSLFEQGADIVDVGGESTRPGAGPLSPEDEIRRVAPVVQALRDRGAGPLSIDTTKAAVARAALEAGADMVNDVSGFSYDPGLAPLVAERGVPAVLMHLRGGFASMHDRPRYHDVMGEVVAELQAAVARGLAAGVPWEQVIADPGIGFAKDASHSLAVLRRLPELSALDRPVLVGPSRKSFIGKVLDLPAGERLLGTAAAVAACVLGGAHLVRVHDVREMLQVVRLCDAIREAA
jgi:dihydropteroate synthase